MSFSNFLSGLKSKAGELKTEALKYKNKDFLNAAMAGSALVSMADGSVSEEEKQKMTKFIESNDALSVFSSNDVIKAFHEFVGHIESDKDIGEAKAYQALGKMKSNVDRQDLTIFYDQIDPIENPFSSHLIDDRFQADDGGGIIG